MNKVNRAEREAERGGEEQACVCARACVCACVSKREANKRGKQVKHIKSVFE